MMRSEEDGTISFETRMASFMDGSRRRICNALDSISFYVLLVG